MRQATRRRLRTWMLFLGFGGAMLLVLTALVLDRGLGREVLLIVPHDPETVELNRALFIEGDPVPELHGNPSREAVRVVLPDPAALIRPPEAPGLLLLRVDEGAGENPLQARTVWFVSRFAVPPVLLLGLGGLFVRGREARGAEFRERRRWTRAR